MAQTIMEFMFKKDARMELLLESILFKFLVDHVSSFEDGLVKLHQFQFELH